MASLKQFIQRLIGTRTPSKAATQLTPAGPGEPQEGPGSGQKTRIVRVGGGAGYEEVGGKVVKVMQPVKEDVAKETDQVSISIEANHRQTEQVIDLLTEFIIRHGLAGVKGAVFATLGILEAIINNPSKPAPGTIEVLVGKERYRDLTIEFRYAGPSFNPMDQAEQELQVASKFGNPRRDFARFEHTWLAGMNSLRMAGPCA